MAKLWITEFNNNFYAGTLASQLPVANLSGSATQVVTFTTSTQSAALGAKTQFVRVIADADCHITHAANPAATTSDIKLIAGVPEYFSVTPGQKIAAIVVA